MKVECPPVVLDVETKRREEEADETVQPVAEAETGEKEENVEVEVTKEEKEGEKEEEKVTVETEPMVRAEEQPIEPAGPVLVVDVKTPPKKPPRGLVDVDASDTTVTLPHVHLETSPPHLQQSILPVIDTVKTGNFFQLQSKHVTMCTISGITLVFHLKFKSLNISVSNEQIFFYLIISLAFKGLTNLRKPKPLFLPVFCLHVTCRTHRQLANLC